MTRPMFVLQYALGREPVVNVSERLGIRALAAAAVNATCYMVWEEQSA